jgi:hypothetical protein
VDQLIADETKMSIGETDFVLYPAAGGETSDALMVYLPASGVLFTGDVMMLYLGAPFFAEGSPGGLLDTLRLIAEIGPRVLVHGHTTLTEQFTVDAVPGLLAALTELRDQSLAGIGRGLTLTELLKANILPEVLREYPAAVGPYLITRDHFVQRLHRQHTGYWQPDGQGLEPIDAAHRAAALDLLADGQPEHFASTARAIRLPGGDFGGAAAGQSMRSRKLRCRPRCCLMARANQRRVTPSMTLTRSLPPT